MLIADLTQPALDAARAQIDAVKPGATRTVVMDVADEDAVVAGLKDCERDFGPVRGLVNAGTKRFLEHQGETLRRFQSGELTKEAAQLSIEHFWAGALRRAVIDGDIEQGSVMAGQSVGMVTSVQPTAAIDLNEEWIAWLRNEALPSYVANAEDYDESAGDSRTS